MSRRRDNFSNSVRSILAHRAGFRCSKPDCRAPTAGPSVSAIDRRSIGIAAHITAASPGGPRYDSSLSSEQRRAVTNGIWLCDNHATEVDRDPDCYTTVLLREWKRHAEEEARAMLGRPICSAAFEVAIEPSIQRDTMGGLAIVGATNLPAGTKLMGDLVGLVDAGYRGSSRGSVHDEQFLIGSFTRDKEEISQQFFRVELVSYFNEAWRQPSNVLALVGHGGERLAGNLVQPTDPDIDDTEYIVRAVFECPAPPMVGEPELSASEIENAERLVRAAVLEVEGREPPKSSESVEDVVSRFMEYPGLCATEGWRADQVAPGLVDVTFTFQSGRDRAIARWQAIPRAGQVRYRNQMAKLLSWSPAD